MNENIFDVFNSVLHNGSEHKVYGKRVVVIKPTDEDWRERINLFLAAAVYYLRENFPNECCYSALVEIVYKAFRMCVEDRLDELDEMFCGWSENRLSEKYYLEFLEKSPQWRKVGVIIAAEAKLQLYFFDKKKTAEFERVFEI